MSAEKGVDESNLSLGHRDTRTPRTSASGDHRRRQSLSLTVGNGAGVPRRAEWVENAACAAPDVDPELFFPAMGEAAPDAKLICARCPVAEQCLEHALTQPEVYGIWGGKSAYERDLRRRGRAHLSKHQEGRCPNGHEIDTPLIRCPECRRQEHKRYRARVKAGLVPGRSKARRSRAKKGESA